MGLDILGVIVNAHSLDWLSVSESGIVKIWEFDTLKFKINYWLSI